MKQRIITAVVGLCIFIPVCIFSETIVFPIALALLGAIGVFELARCVGMGKNLVLLIPMLLLALAAPIAERYLETSLFLPILFASVFFVLIYTFAYVVFMRGNAQFENVCAFYVSTFYVIASFASIGLIRDMAFGEKLFVLPFLGAWISDSFAYFVGRAIGKHKLIPEISPKKTVEGAIGGIVFAVLAFLGYALILNLWLDYPANYLLFALMGLIGAVISQIGDLIASAIKRNYGIKDYGNLFPGHGGVMDRFDSVLLVAPAIYMVLAAVYGI